MKIELDNLGSNTQKIDGYSTGQVIVGGNTYTSSLLITPQSLDTEWPPEYFSALSIEHIERIRALSPELLLLGTGRDLHFPEEKLMRPLIEQNIGYEIMDTGAACRSFNYLIGEGRNVVAALFMIE